MRSESDVSSDWLYKSEVKMTVMKMEIDEIDYIWLEKFMDNDQTRVVMNAASALMNQEDPKKITIH